MFLSSSLWTDYTSCLNRDKCHQHGIYMAFSLMHCYIHFNMIRITIQENDFSLEQEINRLRKDRVDIGAIASFTGLVRDLNEGDEVSLLTLEHYPGMTENQLYEIASEAESRWPLQAITIIHRVGTLAPGDQIVLVITASPHRAAAYESNEFIMDYLKTRATFWKKEELESRSRWVKSRHSDDDAADRWKKPA